MKILVSGATGFVGQHLCRYLMNNDIDFSAVVRQRSNTLKADQFEIKEMNGLTDWTKCLKDIDVVIHLAGRAHVVDVDPTDTYQAYSEINIDATKGLAHQAAASGVKRFIFVSSVGVNGNQSDVAFSEQHPPDPKEYYAMSKRTAEVELMSVAKKTELEVVIIRPPLVYGRGVKANFKKLINLSQLKMLPFGLINNRRSLIYVENLVDFIIRCIDHPGAANETFLVSDDEDVSTANLIRMIAAAANKKIYLIPFPKEILKLLFNLIGKKAIYSKVCGDLYVDITKAKTLVNWSPPFTLKQGIAKTLIDQ